MASVGDLLKGNVGTGLLIGIGVVALAPVIAPVIAAVAKPIIKTLIKSGIIAYEKSKEAFAEAGEAFEDLVAEAAAELDTAEKAAGGNGDGSRSRAKPVAARA